MQNKKQLTKDQALEQIKQYCAYQERCHHEVKEKLFTYGLKKTETDELIAVLIENNYLNEERFAVQFALGKFRMKQWGRKKIKYELQQKRVSPFIIAAALKEINENDYSKTLKKLAETKWSSLKNEGDFLRFGKTNAYLVQKGYEPSIITEVLKETFAMK